SRLRQKMIARRTNRTIEPVERATPEKMQWNTAADRKGGAMARSDDDTWDITQSVGATAFGCAEWRAREAEHEHPLFTDPYAQFFVDEVTARGGSSVIHSNLFLWLQQNYPHLMREILAVGEYNGSRTKWFDDYFMASRAKVAQAVIV